MPYVLPRVMQVRDNLNKSTFTSVLLCQSHLSPCIRVVTCTWIADARFVLAVPSHAHATRSLLIFLLFQVLKTPLPSVTPRWGRRSWRSASTPTATTLHTSWSLTTSQRSWPLTSTSHQQSEPTDQCPFPCTRHRLLVCQEAPALASLLPLP